MKMGRCTVLTCLVSFVVVLISVSVSHADLVALWLFDEGAGDQVKDSSGKGNDGKLDGPNWIDGQFGKALEFKDVGDLVDVGNNIQPGESMSVTAWIYNYGVPDSFGMILIKWSGQRSYQVNLFKGQELAFFLGDKDNTMFRINEAANHPERSVGENQWTHIAAVADSAAKKMKIYVNGDEVGSLDYTGTINQLDMPASIGNKAEKSVRHQFLGIIDELAIFDHALTQNEIKEIMAQGLEQAVLKIPSTVNASGKLAVAWGSVKSER